MSKPPVGLPPASDPDAIVDFLGQLAGILDARIGHSDFNKSDTDRPNGRLDNIRESYVYAEITAPNVAVTFSHNLNVPVPSGGGINVAWDALCFAHTGAGSAPGPLSLEYVDGDTITTNSIALRLREGGTRTIDASNPVRVLARFVAVSKW